MLFQVKYYILCTKEANQSANILEFWVLRSKFTKFLAFLKQQIDFFFKFILTLQCHET